MLLKERFLLSLVFLFTFIIELERQLLALRKAR